MMTQSNVQVEEKVKKEKKVKKKTVKKLELFMSDD